MNRFSPGQPRPGAGTWNAYTGWSAPLTTIANSRPSIAHHAESAVNAVVPTHVGRALGARRREPGPDPAATHRIRALEPQLVHACAAAPVKEGLAGRRPLPAMCRLEFRRVAAVRDLHHAWLRHREVEREDVAALAEARVHQQAPIRVDGRHAVGRERDVRDALRPGADRAVRVARRGIEPAQAGTRLARRGGPVDPLDRIVGAEPAGDHRGPVRGSAQPPPAREIEGVRRPTRHAVAGHAQLLQAAEHQQASRAGVVLDVIVGVRWQWRAVRKRTLLVAPEQPVGVATNGSESRDQRPDSTSKA